eukprot:scaffold254710_cov21-Tisochrysis_lutea.AAC.1
MLASISLGGGQQGRASSKPGTGASSNVLCDMAMARDEVKARLAPIPVYTVANPKNEFVLVAGEVGGCLIVCMPGRVCQLILSTGQCRFKPILLTAPA